MIIPVETKSENYDIVLERGILNKASHYIDLDRNVLIVTDDGVPKKYSETVALQCKNPLIVTLNQGEDSKSLDVFRMLCSKMLENNFTRKDCVVAVGGGVVGDVSAFAAGCYMRGIDFYNIPTTVLSQVDSSVGGKSAVNLDGVKNIVGIFNQPKKVLIDSDTLKTLSQRHFSNGLAESIKMALTSDKSLFELFEKENCKENIDKIIEKSLIIKRDVVVQDERESGLRRILNFGHTLGHGIESLYGMSQLYHGECVALGMLPMLDKSLRSRTKKVLLNVGLPVNAEINIDEIKKVISHDKKVDGDGILVTVVNTIGQYEMTKMTVDQLCARCAEVFNK